MTFLVEFTKFIILQSLVKCDTVHGQLESPLKNLNLRVSVGTYQFLNRQVFGPGKLDFFLDSASLVVGLMIFGNFYIWSARSF